MTGLIVLAIIIILLIIDAWRNNWAGTKAVLGIFNNTVIRRVLRILLILAITVGSLFIISTIGFLTKITWLTVIPVAAAMIVIWITLISGAALEQATRGFAKLLGFNIVSQTTLESWEKNFLSVSFWAYLMLALYPVYNPWTGNPAMVIFIAMFGLALATYARWAAGAGKRPKILGLILVPLLFLYCLGKQQPSAYPTLGSLVRKSESWRGKTNARRDLSSAVDDRVTQNRKDAEKIVQNIREAALKNGIKPLDRDGNAMILQEHERDKVRIERKIDGAKLKAIAPNLTAYLNPGTNDEFYEIKLKDVNGRYSSNSRVGFVETLDVDEEAIEIPKEPRINDPNKKNKQHRGSSFENEKSIILSSTAWSEKIIPPAGVDFYVDGPPDALIRFEADGTTGPITKAYGMSTKWLEGFRLKGPDGEKATITMARR